MRQRESEGIFTWEVIRASRNCRAKENLQGALEDIFSSLQGFVMEKKRIPILIENEQLLPFYGSKLAAGADIRASNPEEIHIPPGKTALIPTGIRMEIPQGYEIQIRPRSGLALKHQITVLNSPATIDADYRGEIKVILINHGSEPFIVTHGMRIAQMVLAQVVQADFVIEESLTASTRGEGGFGHTGTH